MSRYTVVWSPLALGELAEMWLAATDRAALNGAVAAIDAALAEDPQTKGDELAEGLRKLVQEPLSAVFSVRDQDRIAEVAMIFFKVPRPPGA